MFQHFVSPQHRKGHVAIGKRRDTQLSHGTEERKQFLQSILVRSCNSIEEREYNIKLIALSFSRENCHIHNLMLWSHLDDEVQRLHPHSSSQPSFSTLATHALLTVTSQDTLRQHGGSCLGDWLNCFFVHSASGRHCWKLARSVGASGVPLLWCSAGVVAGEDI